MWSHPAYGGAVARYDVTPSAGGAGAHHRPWWESDIPDNPPPTTPVIDIADPTPPAPVAADEVPAPAPAATTDLAARGLTGRGVFLFMVIPALIGCLVGFALQGATSIPPAAGYGLIVGSLLAALKASPRLGWFPVWLPPVAMLAVILIGGQLTLLGSRPTLSREATMTMANLAATAPAQIAAMAVVAVVLFVRRRARRRTT